MASQKRKADALSIATGTADAPATPQPIPHKESDKPRALRGYNKQGELWWTPEGQKRSRRPPKHLCYDGTFATVDSPLNESPIAAAASSLKKLNIDPDTFVGDQIAGKIGELTFFGNVLSHRWLHGKKLWFIQYDCGDAEDVTMKQLMERQQLF